MALEKQIIIDAALRLLDEVGADGLSMRVLAKALAVQAPTLYWHFPSKQALLDQMADAIVASVPKSVKASDDPEELLRSVAMALRAALLSRRDAARVYAGSYRLGSNVLAMTDLTLGALLRKGLTEQRAADAMFNLFSFVLGFALDEQGFGERWRSSDTKQKEDGAKGEFVEAVNELLPSVKRCMGEIVRADFERRFREGVRALLRATDE
jgi:TetR/AcrR family tetracycline transcriptional repressor